MKIRRTGSCTYPTEGHVTPKIRHDFSPLIIDMPAQTSVHRKSSSTYSMTKVVWVQTTTSNKCAWPLSKTTEHDTIMIVLSFSPTLLSLRESTLKMPDRKHYNGKVLFLAMPCSEIKPFVISQVYLVRCKSRPLFSNLFSALSSQHSSAASIPDDKIHPSKAPHVETKGKADLFSPEGAFWRSFLWSAYFFRNDEKTFLLRSSLVLRNVPFITVSGYKNSMFVHISQTFRWEVP